MALMIKENRVVYVTPPKKLASREKKIMKEAPVKIEIIEKATAKTYKVV